MVFAWQKQSIQKRKNNGSLILHVKNLVEIALSSMVFEIQAFLCFAFSKKNLKIPNGRLFWQVKNSLKLGKTRLHTPPVDQKFWQNPFVALFLRYKHFFVLQFLRKIRNSKWPPFLTRQNFFENWVSYSAVLPCGSKILSKSLYLAWFSRYKHFCIFFFFLH